jgi:hypothetical protein
MPRVLQQLATFGGAAALVAAVFTLLCFVVLPKEQRYRARMPTAMLGLFALSAVVHVITDAPSTWCTTPSAPSGCSS